MNLSAFAEGRFKHVREDISEVMAVAKPFGVPFKVIIEVGLLTDQQIATAAELVADLGADFVKTCTGFGPGRANVRNISLIKKVVGDRIGIKASGGVASVEDGIAFMRAGANIVAMRGHLIDQLLDLGWKKPEK
jgi:deoxyribose-phosphate aldolase